MKLKKSMLIFLRNNLNKSHACRIKFLSKKVALLKKLNIQIEIMIKLILKHIYYLQTIKFENKKFKIKYSN
jgi:hypothetical protein